ncbi:MAG TPA: glycoside hydrolase family 9 protein, partial [Verrucomicrobiota bacterium]|nr:glycoside hydrolase family 9 protein [Verrucomicrobiota bacterium]
MRTRIQNPGTPLHVALLACCLAASVHAAPVAVRLNSIGFLSNFPKQASVAAPGTNFAVIRQSDSAVVFRGALSGPRTNSDTGEALWTADFSGFNTPGAYQIEVPGVGRSAPFRIGSDIYLEPFYVVTRGMYLWRCGTAVRGTHGGHTYAHAVCHTNDAWMDYVGGGHVRMDANGGWHDAGDYNKYVVNAGVTVGCLLRAWVDFEPAIRRVGLDIPESGGPLPDFLAEIRWELDWLLRMQATNGAVYHKVSTRDFCPFIMPEHEKDERYFVPWGSAATADFVAMLAMASRCYRPFDAAYADRLLAAARLSYRFLRENPSHHSPDQRGFSTGGYGTRDPDDRLWAAAEMWETTGDAIALRDFEERARAINGRVDINWDWGEVANLGLLTYLFSERSGRDGELVAVIRSNLLASADAIVRARDDHGYARPLGTRYYWGCNGGVARQVLVLQAAYRLTGEKRYRETSADALNHLFGRNVFGRSYVTGLGFEPPMHPHDRRSGADGIAPPWPGYLVGGPNPRARDWHDVEEDYRTNEIAINWNGALIYALAAMACNLLLGYTG